MAQGFSRGPELHAAAPREYGTPGPADVPPSGMAAAGALAVEKAAGGAPALWLAHPAWCEEMPQGARSCRMDDWREAARAVAPGGRQGEPAVFGVLLPATVEDARPLFGVLRALLLADPATRVYCAFPRHGRKAWLEFFGAGGFTSESAGDLDGGVLYRIDCSTANYEGFLERHGLPPHTATTLLVGTEHAGWRVAGGIGAYVEEMERLAPTGSLALCLVPPGDVPWPTEEFAREHRLVHPASWFSGNRLPRTMERAALELSRQAAFYLPALGCVEYQEFLGVGVEIAKGANEGLLPPWVVCRARCHGDTVYLENASGCWMGEPGQLRTAYMERLSVELAGEASFPSRFLRTLYENSGYRLDAEKCVHAAYPARVPGPPEARDYSMADTLVFFGRRNRAKGFPEFVRALEILAVRGITSIRRVVLLGRRDPWLAGENDRLAGLPMEIKEIECSRREATRTLAELAPNALCVLPYRGDNHPCSVTEAVFAGIPVLCANAGGIPELIPQEFHRDVLCPVDPEGLAASILRATAMSGDKRRALARALFDATADRLAEVNRGLCRPASSPSAPPSEHEGSPTARVVVFSPRTEETLALAAALNAQTLFPDTVLVAGDPVLTMEAEAGLTQLSMPWESAEARGGAQVPGIDYTLFLAPGCVPGPDLFRRLVLALQGRPDAVVSCCHVHMVKEGGGRFVLRPMGVDGPLWQAVEQGVPPAFCVRGGPALAADSHERVYAALAGAGRVAVVPRILATAPSAGCRESLFRALHNAAGVREVGRYDALRLCAALDSLCAAYDSPAMTLARRLSAAPGLARTAKAFLGRAARVEEAVSRRTRGK